MQRRVKSPCQSQLKGHMIALVFASFLFKMPPPAEWVEVFQPGHMHFYVHVLEVTINYGWALCHLQCISVKWVWQSRGNLCLQLMHAFGATCSLEEADMADGWMSIGEDEVLPCCALRYWASSPPAPGLVHAHALYIYTFVLSLSTIEHFHKCTFLKITVNGLPFSLTSKQFSVKEFYLKIIPWRLFTFRVCPGTKVSC